MLGVNERLCFGQRGHDDHIGNCIGAYFSVENLVERNLTKTDMRICTGPSVGNKWQALRRQFSLVVLGTVNGFAVENPLHFLTTLVCIGGDIDDRQIIKLSRPVVKEYSMRYDVEIEATRQSSDRHGDGHVTLNRPPFRAWAWLCR